MEDIEKKYKLGFYEKLTLTHVICGPKSSLYNYARTTNTHGLAKHGILRATLGNVSDVGTILRKIYTEEGLRALWKGVGANLTGVVPSRAVYFSTYNKAKQICTYMHNDMEENSLVHMISAAAATTVTTLITNPIWLIKTRLQLQSNSLNQILCKPYTGYIDCFLRVLREEGLAGLYRGTSASLLGITESSLNLALYEYLKVNCRNSNKNIESDIFFDKVGSNSDVILFAAVSKFFAATISYPHEVLRTRLREPPSITKPNKSHGRLIGTFIEMVRNEGLTSLYNGYTAHIIRVVPSAMITFFCYELSVSVLR